MNTSLTATNLSAIGKSVAIPRYGARDNRAIKPGAGKPIVDLAAVADIGPGLGAERPDRELDQPRKGHGEARGDSE
jgi:hypothetical protein